MGALGIAILSKKANKSKTKLDFNFDLKDISFKTIGRECNGCSNNCEIVDIYKDNEIQNYRTKNGKAKNIAKQHEIA